MANEDSKRPATLHDVAERAGVSHITVSRVVNGKNNVSPDTAERVRKAMQELVTTDIWGTNSPSLSSISISAKELGYGFSILTVSPDDLRTILATIPTRMVAGTLVYAQQTEVDPTLIEEMAAQHPIVQIGGKLNTSVPRVGYNHYDGAQLIVEHLIEMGHQRIAHITGQLQLWDGLLRQDAWAETLQKHGLPPSPIAYGDFGMGSGVTAMQQLLPHIDQFTAIFAASDAMALGAIHVLHQNGYRVPDDISIAGYDNADYAAVAYPPLTTIDNNMGMIGVQALTYLVELLHNPAETPHQERISPPHLIQRESVRQRS
jgi:DNA-binding LacI/PurR family transcriptional regulator